MARSRLDVKQAAQILGISTDAVHKRAKRGTLESEKDEDGRVFVWLDTDDNGYTTSSQDADDVHPLLLARLENENDFLRRELDRRAEELSEMRRIVAGLVQRVPELDSPQESQRESQPEARESPVTAPEGDSSSTSPPEAERPVSEEGQRAEPRPSFFRRLFLGEG
jgi:hypothetical protein